MSDRRPVVGLRVRIGRHRMLLREAKWHLIELANKRGSPLATTAQRDLALQDGHSLQPVGRPGGPRGCESGVYPLSNLLIS
jgi:hypothetical protein